MHKSVFKLLVCLWIILLLVFVNKTNLLQSKNLTNPSIALHISWPDSILQTMTLEEKIAQLLILRISSDKDTTTILSIMDTIQTYQVGGVCFFQGGIVRQALITNRIQKIK